MEYIAWKTGEHVYSYRTLTDLFKAIERRFAISVVIDPKVELSGAEYMIRINPDDTPEKVMNALKILSDQFNYNIDSDTIYINPL